MRILTNTNKYSHTYTDASRNYGVLIERGDLLADGSKAIGRRATFGLVSGNVSYSATVNPDFLKAFNYSVWYTARADRMDPLWFSFVMNDNRQQTIRVSYRAVARRSIHCEVVHEGSGFFCCCNPMIIVDLDLKLFVF
jgi:hypothetical protein